MRLSVSLSLSVSLKRTHTHTHTFLLLPVCLTYTAHCVIDTSSLVVLSDGFILLVQDEEGASPDGKKRKKIRKVLKDKKLKDETKSAAKAEEERRKRIKERQKLVNLQSLGRTAGAVESGVVHRVVVVPETRKIHLVVCRVLAARRNAESCMLSLWIPPPHVGGGVHTCCL